MFPQMGRFPRKVFFFFSVFFFFFFLKTNSSESHWNHLWSESDRGYPPVALIEMHNNALSHYVYFVAESCPKWNGETIGPLSDKLNALSMQVVLYLIFCKQSLDCVLLRDFP